MTPFEHQRHKPRTPLSRPREHGDLQHIELCAEAPLIEITMRADGFLYKMVRNIVRAVVKVGEDRTSLAQLKQIIAAKNRTAAPGSAPASGLYLEAVGYDEAGKIESGTFPLP